MSDVNTNTTTAAATPSVDPAAATPANPLKAAVVEAKRAPRTLPAGGAKVGDGSVTVRPVKGKTAAKAPAAKAPAKGTAAAKPAPTGVKFAEVFTRTFTDWLLPHGFRLGVSDKPTVVAFEKNGKMRIEITNPSMPGGSKFAEWVVIRKGSTKRPTGKGRDALADELKIAKFVRS
jgi:hypothetical protein